MTLDESFRPRRALDRDVAAGRVTIIVSAEVPQRATEVVGSW
jgi:hypothetical protein